MTEEAGGGGRGHGGRGREGKGLQKQRTTEDAKAVGGSGDTAAQGNIGRDLVRDLRQLNLEELSTCNFQLAERRNIKVGARFPHLLTLICYPGVERACVLLPGKR